MIIVLMNHQCAGGISKRWKKSCRNKNSVVYFASLLVLNRFEFHINHKHRCCYGVMRALANKLINQSTNHLRTNKLTSRQRKQAGRQASKQVGK